MKLREKKQRSRQRGPKSPTEGRGIIAKLARSIESSRRSVYSLCKDAGVSYGSVSRFLDGQRGVTLETASRIASVLGLDLVETRKRGTTTAADVEEPQGPLDEPQPAAADTASLS
jgi:predicted transcriptional regulator